MVEEYRLAQARTALEQAISAADPAAVRRTAVTLAHLLEVLGRREEAGRTWRLAELALQWDAMEPALAIMDPAARAVATSMNRGELLAAGDDVAGARRAFIRALALADRMPEDDPHAGLAPLARIRLAELAEAG